MLYGKSKLNHNCQIIVAAVIFGGVVSFVDFAALASEPSGRGRVIEFGWDTPTIPWLCDNAAIVECTIAFDGIILDLARREGQAGLSRHVWVSTAISSDLQQKADEDVALLNGANFTRLRDDSFFRINSSGWSEPPDWFDSDFNTVVSNTAFVAAAISQTSLAGIAFDPEDYHFNCWHYPGQKYSAIKTFEQYQTQVRQRGREIASAVKSAWPGRDFTLLFLFANSLPYISTQWWGHPLSEDSYGLLPAFVDGLLDEAGEQIRLIDGIESAYPNKTLTQFQGSVSNYEGGASLSADPSRYLSCVGIGFGTWMDYRSNELGWYTNPNEFHLNHFTPETFNQAMDISTDLAELSWVYTQIPDWYLGTVPEAYFNALAGVTGLPPPPLPPGPVDNPKPADGANDVDPNAVLSWSPGENASLHDVYFDTDYNDVNDANTSSSEYKGSQSIDANSYDPLGLLGLGVTYYWRIDEVKNTNVCKGEVWTFTVRGYLIVDDMESYNDDTNRISDTWQARPYPDSNNGASVYLQKTFFHGGKQSMDFVFESYLGTYFTVTRMYSTAQDWTVRGVNHLSLWFRGYSFNSAGQMYVTLKDGSGHSAAVAYDGDANDIKEEEWQEWNILLQDFGDGDVNLTDVRELAIDVDNFIWAGAICFDDIRLYVPRCIPEFRPTADITGDCFVNFKDFVILGSQWFQSPGSPSADIAPDLPDGFVGWLDLAVLADDWFEGEGQLCP